MLLLTILFFVSLRLSAAAAAGSAVKFDFGSLSLSRLVLLGDAHLLNGSIRLTSDLPVPSSSAGRALYSLPVRPSLPFSTFFSFSISLLNPSSAGAGLSFLLSPDPRSLGDPGPFLGILNSTSSPSSSSTIAIEFDTLMDVAFHDINGNHVGIDVNSLVSSAAADLDLSDIDLKSGDLVNAWIEYTGAELHVFVSYSTLRPPDPVLSYPIDLAAYFPGLAYVGFSAATQGSTEVHSIEWWSFSSSSSSSASSAPATSPPPKPSSSSPPPPPPSTFNVTSQLPPPSSPLLVPAPESPKNDSAVENSPTSSPAAYHKRAPAAFAGVASAGALFVLACAGVGFWVFFSRRRRKFPDNNNNNLEAAPSALVNGPKEFSYRQLSLATRSFDSDRVIGHGAFGTVYKGIIPETGAIVAVKRCIRNTEVGRAEFLSELSIIAGLRHRNLLRLQGWCHEKGEILLVYDYMRHGSLDKALFDPGSSPPLSWQHRKGILLGVASALAYLHRECERKVIHRDVKSSNVMLDEGYNARLGDFGLARQLDHDASPDATITAGTMGYLAPEYLLTGRATEKTDVFSFGAVVLEVACGRRPIDGPSKRYTNLVEWVWVLHGEGRLLEAVDGRLEGEFDEEEVRKVMLVGLACSNPDPVMRPGMRGVVQMLSGETEPPVVPVAKPAMTVGTNDQLLLSLQDSVSDYNALGFNLYSSDSSSSDSLESTLRGGGGIVGRASSGSRG